MNGKSTEISEPLQPALGMSLCCVSVASDALATKNRTFFVFIFFGGVFLTKIISFLTGLLLVNAVTPSIDNRIF